MAESDRMRANSALCAPTVIVRAIAMVMWVASSNGSGTGVTSFRVGALSRNRKSAGLAVLDLV